MIRQGLFLILISILFGRANNIKHGGYWLFVLIFTIIAFVSFLIKAREYIWIDF